MTGKAFFTTTKELAELGRENIPEGFRSNTHLIYSSPATLAFNSPGAEGFGVKRAGLSIPDSVMLLVAPGCCGRNTSGLGNLPQYRNRFFFLMMDETDIVTGSHLQKIPRAVEEILQSLKTRPSVVMICITCVDALLGTDMERVCRKAEEVCKIPVRPCYMYALTREGRRPPMVHVRQSLYSLLEPRTKKSRSINFLGFFSPLEEDCELYSIFHQMGIRRIREISRCSTYEEYQEMAEASFNVVLNPEARFAAGDLEKRLGMPYLELRRLYQLDKIHNQYMALGRALGIEINEEPYAGHARKALEDFRKEFPGASFAIGEFQNGEALEMALALVSESFRVREVFATVNEENFIYVEKLAALSPETRVYANLEPTMIYYEETEENKVDFAIGKDAVFYHPGAHSLTWSQDVQPFGYEGAAHLYRALSACGKE
ncbi:MAG: nitrogenase component 1 [Clostridiales bacterium]|nr:nitrogenase component 1 [Clostridiales bacterium]